MSHTAVHKRKNTPLWSLFVVGVFPLLLIHGGKRGNDQKVTGPYICFNDPFVYPALESVPTTLPPLPFPHDRQRKTVNATDSN